MRRGDGAILRDAAERVRQGWCQGAFEDDMNNVCVMGAFDAIGASFEDMNRAATHVLRALNKPLVLADAANELVVWNDEPNRTADQVATALEFAALLADQQEGQEHEDHFSRTQSLCELGVPSYRVRERG